MTKEVTGEVMGEVMGEEWECRLASSRRWSSCASSGASQPKSLAMRIPWKTSDENFTLRSRAAISCLVSFPRLRGEGSAALGEGGGRGLGAFRAGLVKPPTPRGGVRGVWRWVRGWGEGCGLCVGG